MVVAFTTGEIVKVRPSKIVAGHEAEKTNEFLQILGISILKEVSIALKYTNLKSVYMYYHDFFILY